MCVGSGAILIISVNVQVIRQVTADFVVADESIVECCCGELHAASECGGFLCPQTERDQPFHLIQAIAGYSVIFYLERALS